MNEFKCIQCGRKDGLDIETCDSSDTCAKCGHGCRHHEMFADDEVKCLWDGNGNEKECGCGAFVAKMWRN